MNGDRKVLEAVERLKKLKPILDQSNVSLPSGGLSGDLQAVIDAMLNPSNRFLLAKLRNSNIGYYAVLSTASVMNKNSTVDDFVRQFILDLLDLSVTDDGFRSRQIASIITGFLGMQMEMERDKVKKGKGELEGVV